MESYQVFLSFETLFFTVGALWNILNKSKWRGIAWLIRILSQGYGSAVKQRIMAAKVHSTINLFNTWVHKSETIRKGPGARSTFTGYIFSDILPSTRCYLFILPWYHESIKRLIHCFNQSSQDPPLLKDWLHKVETKPLKPELFPSFTSKTKY